LKRVENITVRSHSRILGQTSFTAYQLQGKPLRDLAIDLECGPISGSKPSDHAAFGGQPQGYGPSRTGESMGMNLSATLRKTAPLRVRHPFGSAFSVAVSWPKASKS
jgi:hypothetical protein